MRMSLTEPNPNAKYDTHKRKALDCISLLSLYIQESLFPIPVTSPNLILLHTPSGPLDSVHLLLLHFLNGQRLWRGGH